MYNKPNIVKRFVGDNWEVLLEDYDGFLFMHCYMDEMKLSVLRETKNIMSEMLDWAHEDGYDGIHAITENKRFSSMIPGIVYSEDTEYEGTPMGFYKWAQQ